MMNPLRSLLSLLGVLTIVNCQAQQYIGVMDQLFTVHSAGNFLVNSNSNSRNHSGNFRQKQKLRFTEYLPQLAAMAT